MGIRFLCPNGHRLNVKTFLAGKRGICPDCGVGVDIPLESQIESRKKQKRSTAVANGREDLPDFTQDDLDADEGQSIPTVSPSRPLVLPKKEEGVAPVSGPMPRAESPPAPAVEAPQPAPSAPPVPATADPIEESPAAVWYVRPVSGGQFGPAVGEVMRKWIGEGRVSGDSLVWREGWEEWILAETIFPSLAESSAKPSITAPAPAISVAGPTISRVDRSTSAAKEGDAAGSAFSPYRRPPQNSNATRLAIVIVLGVVTVVLIGVLVFVVTSRNSAPKTPPATANVAAPLDR